MVARILIALGLSLLALLPLGVAVGYFAYGYEPARSGTLSLSGLEQPASIHWTEGGSVVIEAAVEEDLFAALGYYHAADHSWAMTLWRQAALGRLSQWLGETYTDRDRHARLLGFAMLAEETYERLGETDRAALDAYARGANLALASAAVRQDDEYVLLDLEPEPWEPWHALAVERLMAWLGTEALGTEPLASDSTSPAAALSDGALLRFREADAHFREGLRIGGIDRSRAWTVQVDSTTVAAQQHTYGASALPLIREATLRLGGRSYLVATIPGTLMFPGGHSEDGMWSVFLTSSLTVAPANSPPPPALFDRLVDDQGNETLLIIPRSPEGLFLEAAPAEGPEGSASAVDSLLGAPGTGETEDELGPAAPDVGAREASPRGWLLRWPGFGAATDIAAWRSLLHATDSTTFVLIRGDGLLVNASGETRILGDPPVRESVPGGLIVAADRRATFAARRLRSVVPATDALPASDGSMPPERLVTDTYSPWAAELAPVLMEALGHRDSLDASLKDAYAFLRGWDYHYDHGSIGASIFELWMTAHEKLAGRIPAGRPDSAETITLPRSLAVAVDVLESHHGEWEGGWRWEFVQPGTRYYPIWNDRGRDGYPAPFAPLVRGLGGHPTALFYGPALVSERDAVSASWTLWTTTTSWEESHIVHPVLDLADLTARQERDPGLSSVSRRRDARAETALRLVPAR